LIFAQNLSQTLLPKSNTMPSENKARQRHHDYYVAQLRKGKLLVEELPNLQLAMKREKAGEVNPLSGGRLDSVRLFFATMSYNLTKLVYGPKKLHPKHQNTETHEDDNSTK